MKNEKPVTNPLIVLREEFDDWAVLFDPEKGKAFGLNPVGVFIWKLLDGEHTIHDVLESIGRHAQDVPDEAGDHITEFVDELITRGLVGSDITSSSFVGNMANTTLRLERHTDERPGDANDTGTLKYERPMLVGFNQAAHGTCAYGSGDADACQTGKTATAFCNNGSSAKGSGCTLTGNAATTGCMYNGNSAAQACTGGVTAQLGCADGS